MNARLRADLIWAAGLTLLVLLAYDIFFILGTIVGTVTAVFGGDPMGITSSTIMMYSLILLLTFVITLLVHLIRDQKIVWPRFLSLIVGLTLLVSIGPDLTYNIPYWFGYVCGRWELACMPTPVVFFLMVAILFGISYGIVRLVRRIPWTTS